jgi:hypothetical protein
VVWPDKQLFVWVCLGRTWLSLPAVSPFVLKEFSDGPHSTFRKQPHNAGTADGLNTRLPDCIGYGVPVRVKPLGNVTNSQHVHNQISQKTVLTF